MQVPNRNLKIKSQNLKKIPLKRSNFRKYFKRKSSPYKAKCQKRVASFVFRRQDKELEL